MTFPVGSATRVARGTNSNGWNGWGSVVLHYASTAATTQSVAPNLIEQPLGGRHHAILRYRWRLNAGGPVDATVHWFFATGRSEPVYAITLDTTPAGMNAVNADTRAPYGDMAFEGSRTDIGGIGWGDTHRFTTNCTGALNMACPWDYSPTNTIPFVRMWALNSNAEMGAVQTTTEADHPGGGDYGGGLLAADCRGRTSANKGANCSTSPGVMPTDWMWPYQLNQYELPFVTDSHRLAWGMTYGAVGQVGYQHFGATKSGYPYQSYSVFLVLGRKTPSDTLAQVQTVERFVAARVTTTEGSVASTGPGGVARTDNVAYAVPGWSPVYGTYELQAQAGRATFTLTPMGGEVKSPIFRVRGMASAPTQISANGQPLTFDQHVFVTHDTATQTTWLTLNGTVSRAVTIHVQ